MANDPASLRAAGLDPNFSDPVVYGPARPAEQRPQSSILDMLRSRMSNEMENERAQRISDLGNALLTSRSPSLLGALGEGFRAQDEGTRSRMDRLRQLAETERQQQELETRQAAQRDEAEYRRQSLTLREREIAQQNRPQYTVVGQDNEGNAIVVDMRNPTQQQTLRGVTPLQVATLNARSEVSNRQTAARLAEAAVNREATNRAQLGRPELTASERATLSRQYEAQYLQSFGLQPATGTGAPTTSGGAQPDQVLTFTPTPPATTRSGPRIAPQQQ